MRYRRLFSRRADHPGHDPSTNCRRPHAWRAGRRLALEVLENRRVLSGWLGTVSVETSHDQEQCLNDPVVVQGDETGQDEGNGAFVTVEGTDFYLDGRKFRFAGTNAYYLWYGAFDPSSVQPNQGCVTELLDDAEALGLNVIRTWGSAEGVWKYGYCFQPTLGDYDEATFAHFDRVVQEAANRNLKLIVTLVNNWSDFGGMNRYNTWCGAGSHDEFYTNASTKAAYQNYVRYFLNRENSLTGVLYKEDPTIMAWELANEPRCRSDPTGATLNAWIEQMSGFIKSIDTNHLVTTGIDGGYLDKEGYPPYAWWYKGFEGQDFLGNHEWNTIDFATFHYYRDMDPSLVPETWIQEHIQDAHNVVGKPVVFEEFNTSDVANRDEVLDTWYGIVESEGGNGDTLWMLADSQFAGNNDGYFVFYPEDNDVCQVVSDHADYMAHPATLAARHIFYNDSEWDGNDAEANANDDNAIHPSPPCSDPAHSVSPEWDELGKQALLPGETASSVNYTSYSKGINGIMVDIAGLPGTPTADDFEFRMGNDDTPNDWGSAPEPSSVTVRPGEGVGGSDRITIIWPNYDTVHPDPTTQAVAKQWLQVTVLANANTGLAEPDVFCWGNAVGESGLGNFGGAALVNAVDSGAVRDNPHNPFIEPAPICDPCDFNRDQWVNAVDFGFVRDNATNPSTALKLITAPAAAPSPGPEGAPAGARIDRGALHDEAIGELNTEREAPADGMSYLPGLSWLDVSDLPEARGQSATTVSPAVAAVERLLATL